MVVFLFFFFFQAEDGIRDKLVTGVQTCALPIWLLSGCLCTQAPAPWTTEQLAADLDQIAAAVRSEWSYLADRRQNSGVDVDALPAEAKKTLPQVHSADDFARSLRRFGAGLQDGHAWTSVPGESP